MRAVRFAIVIVLLLVGCSTSTSEPAPDPSTSGGRASPAAATPSDSEGTGRLVLFQAIFGQAVDVGIVSPGRRPTRLPGGPGNRWHPMWSPDGTMISYDHDHVTPDVDEIWVHDLSTGEDRAVADCAPPCLGHQGAAWHPDGRTIVFDGADDATDEHPDGLCYLGLVDVETGAVEHLAEWPGCLAERDDDEINGAGWPQYRPDGELLVVQGVGPGGSSAVFTLDPETGATVQLTDWGGGARPVWSPDGDWIAFQTAEPEQPGGGVIAIHRMRPDGTDVEQLTHPEGTAVDLYPWWDETGIVFTRCAARLSMDCRSLVLDPATGAEEPYLSGLGDQPGHVIPQPAGR